MPVTLWKHQIEAIAWAMSRRDVLLHCGMGTGKTRVALEIIRQIIAGNPHARVLVGCPKAVIAAWIKQAAMWLPGVRVLALTRGTSKAKEEAIQAAMADTSPLIIVGNYETLWRIKATEGVKWSLLVWDEVHRLKSPSGAASRWAAKVCKKNPQAKRVGMSGTLLSHSPLDAYGVWRAVETPECPTFGTSYTTFKARYFMPHPAIRGAILGLRRDAEPEFSKRVNGTTFHRRSEDVLDLPPLMFDDVEVELTPKEAALYREVETEFCAACDDGTITVSNAMVQVLRLQQICGGYVKYDETEAARRIDETPSKQGVLEERLEDLSRDEPVVVFCRFRTDIDSVLDACRRVGRTASELSGRLNTLADWQAGKTNVLVAQIQSGGIGIDLTRCGDRNCCYGFFYSLGYSLSEYLQAVARLHRPGQEQTTRFYHLVARLPNTKRTVDGRIYEALSKRQEVLDAIIRGYKERTVEAAHTAGRDH